MAYVDPPDFVANKKVSASGAQGTTDPYAINANIVNAIKALYDLLTGDEAPTVDFKFVTGAGKDFIVKLSDAAGARKFIIQDSGGVDVASIDSNGVLTATLPAHTHTHASTTGQTTDDHHAKAHDHTSADGSGVLTNDEHDGYSEMAQIAKPGNPAAGKVRVYPKTDKKLYLLDEDGTETDLTAGGAGGSVATDAIWDALGDLVYGTGANTGAKLAGNTAATKKFLTQTGDGAASAAPGWNTIAAADYPTMVGDAGAGGNKGAVPAPAAGDAAAGKYLRADGTWAAPSGTGAPASYPYLGFGTDAGLSAEVDATACIFANEIMNFPSLELANDTQPEWWEVTADATLTEVDVAGEAGITETYERAHKLVTTADAKGYYQRFTYADQPRLKSGVKVSLIVAVWSVDNAAARVKLVTSTPTSSASADTTAAAWTLLTVNGLTLDGTYVDLLCEVDTGTAYFVPLALMVGGRAVPLAPRGTVYRHIDNAVELVSLTGKGDEDTWTDVDCTAKTSNITCMVNLVTVIYDTSDSFWLYLRRNGSSDAKSHINAQGQAFSGATLSYNSKLYICDDGQTFEYNLDRTAGTGTLNDGHINLIGYWEWS